MKIEVNIEFEEEEEEDGICLLKGKAGDPFDLMGHLGLGMGRKYQLEQDSIVTDLGPCSFNGVQIIVEDMDISVLNELEDILAKINAYVNRHEEYLKEEEGNE